jgi:hypothetical protein
LKPGLNCGSTWGQGLHDIDRVHLAQCSNSGRQAHWKSLRCISGGRHMPVAVPYLPPCYHARWKKQPPQLVLSAYQSTAWRSVNISGQARNVERCGSTGAIPNGLASKRLLPTGNPCNPAANSPYPRREEIDPSVNDQRVAATVTLIANLPRMRNSSRNRNLPWF